MKAMLEDGKNIYLQIAEQIADDILSGALEEEMLAPSTNQIAKLYAINPATAAKGVNILVDAGILYKKRGIGMCVSAGARQLVLQTRQQEFYNNYLLALLEEAKKLDITDEQLIAMIQNKQPL